MANRRYYFAGRPRFLPGTGGDFSCGLGGIAARLPSTR